MNLPSHLADTSTSELAWGDIPERSTEFFDRFSPETALDSLGGYIGLIFDDLGSNS
jgi:hypothetical protein